MKYLLFLSLYAALHYNIFPQESENMMEFNPNKIITSDTNYCPLHINNRWQYINSIYDDDGPNYKLIIAKVTKDTIIANRLYYYLDGIFTDLIRYSSLEKKLYIRWNDSDFVNIDFNIPDGVQYQSFNNGQYYNVYAKCGEDSIFDQIRPYGGYLWIGTGWETSPLFSDSVGMYYYRGATTHGTAVYDIIAAILYDSLGNTIKYSYRKSPSFQIIPVTQIDSQTIHLEFKIFHPYTILLGGNPPPWHHGIDFISSVRMYSFYANMDTVISNPPVSPYHITDPVNRDYSVLIHLDTMLMKSGYTFNYRFLAVDKCIIPDSTFSPDTGFYVCVWNGPSEINNDENEELKFSLNQNFPNPFNPETIISYQLASSSFTSLKVYNTLGEEVVTLVNDLKAAGTYQVNFYAGNLPSGVYIYRLTAGDFSDTKKLLLLK